MDELTRANIAFKNPFLPFTTTKAIIIIIIIGFITYFNSLFNPFIFDDNGQIVNNLTVHSISNILNIFLNRFDSSLVNLYYKPIQFLIFTIIYSIVGSNTFLYHLLQLIFHISNSILVFLIFKRYMKYNLSFILSLLFLIHPINNDTVVYISNLQDVLFVFFGLISLYLLQKDLQKKRHIFFVNLFLLLSILSKETGALFFIIDFIYIYFFQKTKIKIFSLFSLLIIILYLPLRFLVTSDIPENAIIPIMSLNFWERMSNVPLIILYYFKTLLYPKDLIHINTWIIQDINLTNFYIPILIDIGILTCFSCMYIYLYKKKKYISFLFFSWIVIGLGIHLHIIPLDATANNRWFYFPFIGILGLVGLFFQNIKISKTIEKGCIIIVFILIFILILRSIERNIDWRNEYTILVNDIKISKNDYMVELLYGNYLVKNNKNDEAYTHIMKAIKLFPENELAWTLLGNYYYNKNKKSAAMKAWQKSISLKENIHAYENLALSLSLNDQSDKTLNFIRKATGKFPFSEKLWYRRLLMEYTHGNLDYALLSAQNYNYLKKDAESYNIYNHLLQNRPININWDK